MNPETVPETLPIGESDSVPDSDEETEEIEDTSTLDQPEEHSGECLGVLGRCGLWKRGAFLLYHCSALHG